MDLRTLQLLEFPKILRHLATCTVSEAGYNQCLALEPLTDLDQIISRNALLRETLIFCSIQDLSLSPFPDISGVFVFLRSPLAVLDQDGLVGLWETLKTAAQLRESLPGPENVQYPFLASLVAALVLPVKTWSALKRCLTPEGKIRDEASPELYSVRQEIRRVQQMCTRKVQDFFQNNDLQFMLQDEYLTISSDRYVLALKTNFKGRLKGIVHDYSQTGETCYFEPLFLVDLNNDLQELKQEERSEEQKVLHFLTDLVRAEQQDLARTFETLVQFDVLLAQKSFARKTDARVIDVAANAPLCLLQARHPLLVCGTDQVVPVDIVLEQGQRALIITGGNAGGKTVCLKTMGLLGLMAHAGLPVTAAEGSSLPYWNNFVVSMGDEQSIEQNLSTFTAQIRHFSAVWPKIDAQTLVILDEFGVGTDPSQGAALAQAVVDSLLERQAWIGVATHFPALKAYGLSRDGVRAASVIFSPKTEQPLYKLGYDQVGASRALEVARDQGLPENILSRAQEYLYLDSSDTEEIFERLNRLAAAKEDELIQLRAQGRALEEKYIRKLTALDAERTRMLGELRQTSRCILDEWRQGRLGRKEALKDLARLREDVAGPALDVEAELVAQAIAPGQDLLYLPWDKSGQALEVDEKKNRVRLAVGGVALWVDIRDLRSVSPKKAPKSVPGAVFVPASSKLMALRLDVRGLRADEAEAELDRFMDKAVLAGRSEVEIVHGMGTGALRRIIHEYLRHCHIVHEFSLARADAGGDGVTRVVLSK